MSKIICDVCGTAFPETDSHCPICGCAKSPLAQPVAEEASPSDMEKPAAGNYPKGGRFVKEPAKRREPAFAAPKAQKRRRDDDEDEAPQQSIKLCLGSGNRDDFYDVFFTCFKPHCGAALNAVMIADGIAHGETVQ